MLVEMVVDWREGMQDGTGTAPQPAEKTRADSERDYLPSFGIDPLRQIA